MKLFYCVAYAAACVAVVPLLLAAPSSADYQALIREATERYRGDFNGQTRITQGFTYYEIDPLYIRDRAAKIFPRSLAPGAFTKIAFFLDENPAVLPSSASNQTLQLTTTAPRPEKIFADLLPSTTIDARHR